MSDEARASDGRSTEACGRCSMTTVVDAVDANRDGDAQDDDARDPFGGERIEIAESDVRRISPVAWTRKATSWLNATAERLTYRQ